MIVKSLRGIALCLVISTCAVQYALAQQGPSANALVEQARVAAQRDQNANSADLFARVIAQDPSRRRELLAEYADQLTYSKRPAQAVPIYEEILQDPRSSEERERAQKGLGLALLWSDQPSRASKVYAQILADHPQDRDAQRSLVRALSWSGRQREALVRANEILAMHPEDDETRTMAAQALSWMGRPDRASETLGSAVDKREIALRLDRQLKIDQAPRALLDTRGSTQSDGLDIRNWRAAQSVTFAQGRGAAGLRVDHTDYRQTKTGDGALVVRPGVYGRYRLNDSFELNGELGQEQIRMADGTTQMRGVGSSWLTWWPDDVLRFDLSTNRDTFDNLKSLRLGITARQHGLSMDFKPTDRQRYTVRVSRSIYSDGNTRDWGQLETEYRWRTHPDMFASLRYTQFSFSTLLDNGYFNPLRYRSTQVTLRTIWTPGGDEGRLHLEGGLALGREVADPGGSKPANDASLRFIYDINQQTQLALRAQRFTSRTADSGFARGLLGLSLEHAW